MKLSKRITLTIIALLGFITSVKLTVIYFDVNFNPYALSSFCSINDFIDCDGVAKTTHSQFFGIPLAVWGLFLYFIFLFLTYVDKLKKIKFLGFLEVFERPESYICALGVIAFTISMSLFALSVFEIHKLCVLCLITYLLKLVIAIAACPDGENYLTVIKNSFQDFWKAFKVKKYGIAFSILTLIAVIFLVYTSASMVLTPQVKKQKEWQEYTKMRDNTYKVSGNVLGDPQATVVVHEYTDYQCPFCFVLNTMLHRAVHELKNIQIVHHNLPLDSECNKNMPGQMHPGSCLLAKYSIAAGKQGKYWDMNTFLFDKENLSEEEVLKGAKSLGLNVEKLKFDAYSEEVAQELQKEIDDSFRLGIDGTPAIRINLETHVGIEPYDELKARLIKAGAKEK